MGINPETKTVVEKFQKDTEASVSHLNLGWYFVEQGNFEQAKQHLFQALRLNPNDAEAYNQLGRISYKEKLFNEAQGYFEKALRLNSKYFEAHYNLAHTFSQKNQFQQAKTHYLKVLEFNPLHLIANYHLALIYFEAEQYSEAILYFEKTLSGDPKHLDAILFLTQSYLALGQSVKAKAIYQQALDLYEHPEIHHNLAVLHLQENEKEAALKHFEKAVELKPDNETAQHMINALTQNPSRDPPPVTYIRDLFDQYSEYYNAHMKEKLNYQVPFLLRESLSEILKDKIKLYRILDLGCGTGLCAIYFRDMSDELIGVDLSPKMLDKAKALDTYEALHESDLIEFLSKENDKPYGIILAADVLCYFGDLENLFLKIQAQLLLGGYFCFSAETLDNGQYILNSTGRFSHAQTYITILSEKHGFEIQEHKNKTIILRNNADSEIKGNLYILKKISPINI